MCRLYVSADTTLIGLWEQQLEYRHLKRFGQAFKIIQRDVPPAPFDMGNKCAVQLALESQFFLRPAAGRP